jgi:hypothetical protein
MRYDDLPNTLAGRIAAAQFPVYGVVNRPLGLILCSYGSGFARDLDQLTDINLIFVSSRYPSYPPDVLPSQNFTIDSMVARDDREISDVNLGPVLKGLIGQERKAFLWEGTLSIANTPFYGTIQYYASPLQISAFLLKSDKTLLLGHAYGPSCDEIIELLEGLQVLNGRDDVLKQYQEERRPIVIDFPME